MATFSLLDPTHAGRPVRHSARQPASHQPTRLFSGSLVGITVVHTVSNSQTAAAQTLQTTFTYASTTAMYSVNRNFKHYVKLNTTCEHLKIHTHGPTNSSYPLSMDRTINKYMFVPYVTLITHNADTTAPGGKVEKGL